MRNAIRIWPLTLLIVLFGACTEDQDSEPNLVNNGIVMSDIEVEYALTCGWGSRADTLQISRDSVSLYQHVRGWGNVGDTIIDTSFLTPIPWRDLLYKNIDMNAFKQLNYNSGGLPFDGCNINLSVDKDSDFHAVLMKYGDSINPIQNFVNQLDSLWIEAGGLFPPEPK